MSGRETPRAFAGVVGAPGAVADWLMHLPGNAHSRRVALLKMALPAVGVTLLLMVVAWPRLAPLFDRLRFAAIDLREARELRMMKPRYAGTDRDGRPFIVTAAIGRQVPQRDDVMALDEPRADLKTHSGAAVVVTADSGVYQPQTQFLDAFGHVTLTHENGTQIVTSSARLDVANNAADGREHVEGHGPNGDIAAQGFRVVDKGAVMFFTGPANMVLKGSKTEGPPPSAGASPGVPAPIAEAAAQLERAQSKPPAHPATPKPAVPPAAAAKPPAHPKPKKPV
ncbi:MAG: LPS export ABC transporter periplasmic protein LptC [Alphaproteobacteria bacterium]|nr:LPS export ABC transporter periplasmic protein LptC [Alphaproteobacteria bacterium]